MARAGKLSKPKSTVCTTCALWVDALSHPGKVVLRREVVMRVHIRKPFCVRANELHDVIYDLSDCPERIIWLFQSRSFVSSRKIQSHVSACRVLRLIKKKDSTWSGGVARGVCVSGSSRQTRRFSGVCFAVFFISPDEKELPERTWSKRGRAWSGLFYGHKLERTCLTVKGFSGHS